MSVKTNLVTSNAGSATSNFYKMAMGLDSDDSSNSSSGTAETDLYTYTLPANSMNTSGDMLLYQGLFDNNGAAATTRTLRIYFAGGSPFNFTFTPTGSEFLMVDVTMTRVSSTSCRIYARTIPNESAVQVNYAQVACDFTTNIQFKMTGQSSNGADYIRTFHNYIYLLPM